MRKLKLFIENFVVYGFGGIISKLIPLIMLPIITRIMPNTFYYGLSDLSNTLIQFASAIAVMGFYDAMYRLFFEKDDKEYKQKVCSTALIFTIIMSVIVFFLMCIFSKQLSKLFFSDSNYSYLVHLSAIATLIGATNTIVAAPTRMENKRKIYLITNTVAPLIAYGLSIPLLLKGYYIIALPVSAIVSVLTLEVIFWILNKSWFRITNFDKRILRQLLIIGVPLLPNLLIYWVFNSCDKVMITNLIGVEASGIYSVASKFGQASQLIYVAFAGGWQYFAFSTMKEQNQVYTNSKIFEYMGVISFAMGALVCAWSYLIFKILFNADYLLGFISAAYLFLAPLLQMLFQIISNQFLIIKKTWPAMLILACGAIINIVLNYILIPMIGIEGASIATLIGYIVSLVICIIVLVKMGLLYVSGRFIILCVTMCAYICIWRRFLIVNTVISTIVALILIAVELYLYKNDIKKLFCGLKKLLNK